MNLKKMFKSKKLAAAIVALTFISGTAFAQSQPPLPPQNQPGQNTGPASQDQGQPGQQPGQHPKPGQPQPGPQPGQYPKPGQPQPGQQPGQNTGPASQDQWQPGQHPKPGQPQPGPQPGQYPKPGQPQPGPQPGQYPKPGQPQPGPQPGQYPKPGQPQPQEWQPGQYPKPGQPQPGPQPGQYPKPGQPQPQEWQHQPKPGQQQTWQAQPQPQPQHWQNQQKPDNGGFEIREMWYKPGGRLQIRLDNNDIRWNNIERVIVRDSHGRAYNARVNRADRDIVELIIAGLIYGENYSIEIPGVHYRDMNYILRGDFWAWDNWRYNRPDTRNFVIQSIRYQNGGHLKIRLYNPREEEIRWDRNARVMVRDSRGRFYDVRIDRARYSTIELTIYGIRPGDRYSIEIPGIRYRGMYYTVRGDFWARHNWSYER